MADAKKIAAAKKEGGKKGQDLSYVFKLFIFQSPLDGYIYACIHAVCHVMMLLSK